MRPLNPPGNIATTSPRYPLRKPSKLSIRRDAAPDAPSPAITNPASKRPPAAAAASTTTTTTSASTSTGNRRSAATTKPLLPTPPATPKLPAVASRTPLRHKAGTQNVLSLTATRSTKTTTLRMPPPPDRPRMPQLSAAAARNVNRTPLTPKIAAAKGPTVVTPLAKRTQSHQAPGYTPAQPYSRDDVATTPTASFLAGNNVTPRSGSRQQRVDSANSTPNGTPVHDRTSDVWDGNRLSGGTTANGGTLGISALSYDAVRHPSPADSGADSSDSKFFYASDAKVPQLPPGPRAPSIPQKSPTFFYANSIAADDSRRPSPAMSPAFSPMVSSTPEPAASKFFYANGAPDISLRPSLPPSGSASTVSSGSRIPAKRPSTASSVTGAMSVAAMPQRPISPLKSMSTHSVQTQKTTISPPNQPGRVASPGAMSPIAGLGPRRQVTIDVPAGRPRGHIRAGSVPTIEPAKFSSLSQSPEITSAPFPPVLSQPAMTMASIIQAAEELSEEAESNDEASPAELQSPTKSSYGSDSVSELVANARRERKVQDLEITNASLEAINRTLERQLRKQTAEIRRYRRLSRTGRISLASVASSRVTSATLTEPPTDLSDVDEDEDQTDEEDLDSFDDSDLTEDDSDPLSPSDKFAARRKRDEKRLQLDLTKHQELLIDSQRMNQSLKRCLSWTEALIKEGQKALEYRVRVSDVELGGHVLAPPDEEEEDESQLADVSTQSIDVSSEPPWVKGPQDRDSGIELPADGS